MSDWQVVGGQNDSPVANASPDSEWQVVPAEKSSTPNESLGAALFKAPFRIGEDVLRGGMSFVKNAPHYYEAAKTEIPGMMDSIQQHPGHMAMQALAGSQEMINNLAQSPLNLVKYAHQRLNLLPESVPNAVAKITPEDTSQAIGQLFDEPTYPGESMVRGTLRNIPAIIGGGKVADVFNPLSYTSKSIAKDIVKTGQKQIDKHSKMYDKLWSDAKKENIYSVPVDGGLLAENLKLIKKYKTEREYKSLEDFMNNRSLSKAQSAQSDMGHIKRALEEKSRTNSLTTEEKALYEAAKESEKHIENRMFMDKSGQVNGALKNRYRQITNSYRDNVVPYRYNADIQAYKNNELLPRELKQRLSRGEFAAKKGKEHPKLMRADLIQKILLGGAAAGGLTLMDLLQNKK